jgi:hypothetical protein
MWRRSGDGGERLVGGHGVIVQPALRLRVAFSTGRAGRGRALGSRERHGPGARRRRALHFRIGSRPGCWHGLHTSTYGPRDAVIGGRLSPWVTVGEKADRAIVALSMRLRISPKARMRRETTAPKGRRPAPMTCWTMPMARRSDLDRRSASCARSAAINSSRGRPTMASRRWAVPVAAGYRRRAELAQGAATAAAADRGDPRRMIEQQCASCGATFSFRPRGGHRRKYCSQPRGSTLPLWRSCRERLPLRSLAGGWSRRTVLCSRFASRAFASRLHALAGTTRT